MGSTPPLSEEEYLALCLWDEARGEAEEGRRAVAQVVLNRRRKRYSSDGTIRGTVLAPNQFSGFWFDFVNGRYQRVCFDQEAADIRAHRLLLNAQKDLYWGTCEHAAEVALHGDLETVLSTDTVLYYNPAVVHSPPAWALPAKLDRIIGHHAFYKA